MRKKMTTEQSEFDYPEHFKIALKYLPQSFNKDRPLSDLTWIYGTEFSISKAVWETQQLKIDRLTKANEVLKGACEKIADPRKRDHKEPDKYTELGCVMNMANEALEKYREIIEDEK